MILQAKFELFAVMKKEGRWYMAHCPSLDITTQGRTEQEVKKIWRRLVSCLW